MQDARVQQLLADLARANGRGDMAEAARIKSTIELYVFSRRGR